MKHSTRLFAAVLAVLMVTGMLFGFAGCHRKDKTDSASIAVTEETKETLADLLGENSKTSTAKASSVRTVTTHTTNAKEATEATKGQATTKQGTTPAAATTTSSGLFQVSADYKAAHPYAIAVNTSQNIVIVYKKGADGNYTVPVKAMACSCGRSGHETPSGQYTTLTKQRWLYLIDGTYGQYCTKFKEHYWFHSVPYYTQDPSDLEWPEYNKLGSNASAGCVRLCVRDVKWIYDNISLGTVVRIYASSASEPLAKPSPVRIDTSDSNEKRGWDPTDPDSANPYH